jgi:hypothetical protein
MSELSPASKWQLVYWQSFARYLEQGHDFPSITKTRPKNDYYLYYVGKAGFRLSAGVVAREGRNSVSLLINRDDSPAYYHLLRQTVNYL